MNHDRPRTRSARIGLAQLPRRQEPRLPRTGPRLRLPRHPQPHHRPAIRPHHADHAPRRRPAWPTTRPRSPRSCQLNARRPLPRPRRRARSIAACVISTPTATAPACPKTWPPSSTASPTKRRASRWSTSAPSPATGHHPRRSLRRTPLRRRHGQRQQARINASTFTVELAPGSGAHLVLTTRRYANPPTLKFPWDRPRTAQVVATRHGR